jgi:hypothetical protein
MAQLLQMNTIRAASVTLTNIPTLCEGTEENHAAEGSFRFLFDQDVNRIYRCCWELG